jgi:RimJ/RimL family protein N-acetyltransferase
MESAPPRAEIPILSQLPLAIDCSKFRLRPIAASDVEDLWPYVSDPAMTKFVSWKPHADRSETAAFIETQVIALANGKTINWAIEIAGKAAGLMTLGGITWRFSTDWRVDRAELGYWLGAAHWGNGITAEAALTATKFGFETVGLHKIKIGHMEGNEASKRIIEGLGFRYVGLQLEDAYKDGRWQHHHRYELTVGEWGDSARTLRFSKPRQP